jgi:rhamnogalacturonyl hydrolase YesR
MAYFAIGYLSLYRNGESDLRCNQAAECLTWLEQNANPNHSGLVWNSSHDYQSRLFYLPQGVPSVVGSFHVARAFMDAYETLDNPHYLEIARSTCNFILRDLPRYSENDSICVSYIPSASISVHNANMLAAALLMRVYQHTTEKELLSLARRAVRYTLNHQRPDGSWFYGEAANLHWIDNFHTGYVLDALKTCLECGLDDKDIREAIQTGNEYFISHFFGPNGEPYMFADRKFPIDIQGAAQSIETLAYQSDHHRKWLPLAQNVAKWVIHNMQASDGHFYFRRSCWSINKVAHIHWGQGTMLVALARLLEIAAGRAVKSSGRLVEISQGDISK